MANRLMLYPFIFGQNNARVKGVCMLSQYWSLRCISIQNNLDTELAGLNYVPLDFKYILRCLCSIKISKKTCLIFQRCLWRMTKLILGSYLFFFSLATLFLHCNSNYIRQSLGVWNNSLFCGWTLKFRNVLDCLL